MQVARPGQEPGQGVGYLDDGTMVVIEDGREYIGRRVEVSITGSHQTSAGRIIFGRLTSQANIDREADGRGDNNNKRKPPCG